MGQQSAGSTAQFDKQQVVGYSGSTREGKKMTRKHFKAIAQALGSTGASKETVSAVAWQLAGFNPRFDRNTFIMACEEAGAEAGDR